MKQRYSFRSYVGLISIFCGAIAGMFFQIIPSDTARIAILSLTPLVAWLASPDVVASGGCPFCYAKKKKQTISGSAFTVALSSRASARGEDVDVTTGWEVTEQVSLICNKCLQVRSSSSLYFIPRNSAATPGEAIVLVKNGKQGQY
ncbi:MAG: hypothetical protein ACKOW9_03410 [Candidatus Paceibacterota bacterium]